MWEKTKNINSQGYFGVVTLRVILFSSLNFYIFQFPSFLPPSLPLKRVREHMSVHKLGMGGGRERENLKQTPMLSTDPDMGLNPMTLT